MPHAARRRSVNLLLQSLGDEDWVAVEPHLRCRPLSDGEVILGANEPIHTAFFPESCVASVHDILNDGRRVGIGIIGFEGMVGWPLLLGSSHSTHEATIAIGGGSASFIDAAMLLRLFHERPGLNQLLLRYVQCFISQMSRTILANLHDSVERRLARWLLMNHDRLDGDEIRLTHDQLGVMLGVRRASVTDALHLLEGDGLINSSRGRIVIRDRARLLILAGEAYGVVEAEYARVIAPFAKSLSTISATTVPSEID